MLSSVLVGTLAGIASAARLATVASWSFGYCTITGTCLAWSSA